MPIREISVSPSVPNEVRLADIKQGEVVQFTSTYSGSVRTAIYIGGLFDQVIGLTANMGAFVARRELMEDATGIRLAPGTVVSFTVRA